MPLEAHGLQIGFCDFQARTDRCEIGVVVGIDAPGAVLKFQRSEVLHPVAAVQIRHFLSVLRGDFPDLRAVDMSADHIVVAFFRGQLDGGFFEVADIFYGAFDAFFDVGGEGDWREAEQIARGVDYSVDADQQVVSLAAEFGQPASPVDAGVEYVAVENPVRLAVHLKHQFIAQVDQAKGQFAEFAEEIVVVSGEVIYLDAVHRHFQDAAHDFRVFFGEIAFFELPDIENIAVEDKRTRFDALQVVEQFARMAAVGAEVQIGNNNDVGFALHR